MPLHRLAHARAGDKGDRLNISLVAYVPELFPLLLDAVTESAATKQFAHRRPTAVKRYVLPKLAAMNFVLDGVLDGGVTQALNLDSHGKTLSFRLLELSVAVPDELAKFARAKPARPI
ncbi:MAG: AtuA-related protein [Pseudolabrys sp.]